MDTVTQGAKDNIDDTKPNLLMDDRQENKPYILTNPYAHLAEIYEGKKFICKGKHEYRNNGGKWVCQCGREL